MNELNGQEQFGGGLSPDLDAASLAQLAGDHPELWEQIIAHPNVYPELQAWIRENLASEPAAEIADLSHDPEVEASFSEILTPGVIEEGFAPVLEPESDQGWAGQEVWDAPESSASDAETAQLTSQFAEPAYGQPQEHFSGQYPEIPHADLPPPYGDIGYQSEPGSLSSPGYAGAPFAYDGTTGDTLGGLGSPGGPGTQGNLAAPVPTTDDAPRKPGRKRMAIIASCVAGALVLGGGGTALALNDIWPFGPDGLFGAGQASSAEELDSGPNFGAGVQEYWSIAADEVTSQTVFASLPRMMTNYVPRSLAPMQIDGAVILQTRGTDDATITMLDSASGEVTWADEAKYIDCVPGESAAEAICALAYGSQTDLVSLTGEGAFDIASVDVQAHGLLREGSEFVLATPGAVTRVDATGAEVWTSEAPQADHAEMIQVAGDKVLAVGANDWRVIGGKGETLAEGFGLDSTNSNSSDRCDFMLTQKKLLMIGSACDDSIETTGITAEVVSRGDAMNIGLVEDRANLPQVWLHSYQDLTTAYDVVSGDELWSGKGVIPGWFIEPQLIMGESQKDDAVLLIDGSSALSVAPKTGEVSELFSVGEGDGHELAVVGGTVLAFDPSSPNVTAYDGMSGRKISEASASGTADMLEALGGRNGALVALPMCVDCSTAEGSATVEKYAFFGPAEAGSTETTVAGVAVPDFIPDCPAKTQVLAWAELSGGWVQLCGAGADAPSFLAYQLSDSDRPVYSEGSDNRTGGAAQDAVEWDDRLARYTARLEDGSILTLDYHLGTLTVRNAADTKTLEQRRLERFLFTPMGDKIRTIQEVSDTEGAFSTRAPKDTAEDQIRYMIDVLEKAYDGRAIVKDALPKLENCMAGPGGYGDTVNAMQAVRDNRAQLLEALAVMPVDKIPEGEALLDDLTEAIRFSHAANIEYVAWAESANASGCASLSSSGQAAARASDAPKERFASRWNSAVAPVYGVRTFDAWYI